MNHFLYREKYLYKEKQEENVEEYCFPVW